MSHAGDEQMTGRLYTRDRRPSNGGQPISTLPPEIFVTIIAEVDLLSRRLNGVKWDTNWTVACQLVCRHWRDVISSTPQFWQQIAIHSSPEWLELCLTRCAGAPATIVVWQPTSPRATFTILCRFASSIEAIYIYSDRPATVSLGARPHPRWSTVELSVVPRCLRLGRKIRTIPIATRTLSFSLVQGSSTPCVRR